MPPPIPPITDPDLLDAVSSLTHAAAHKRGDFYFTVLGTKREPLLDAAQLDYIRWLYQGDADPA